MLLYPSVDACISVPISTSHEIPRCTILNDSTRVPALMLLYVKSDYCILFELVLHIQFTTHSNVEGT